MGNYESEVASNLERAAICGANEIYSWKRWEYWKRRRSAVTARLVKS